MSVSLVPAICAVSHRNREEGFRKGCYLINSALKFVSKSSSRRARITKI